MILFKVCMTFSHDEFRHPQSAELIGLRSFAHDRVCGVHRAQTYAQPLWFRCFVPHLCCFSFAAIPKTRHIIGLWVTRQMIYCLKKHPMVAICCMCWWQVFPRAVMMERKSPYRPMDTSRISSVMNYIANYYKLSWQVTWARLVCSYIYSKHQGCISFVKRIKFYKNYGTLISLNMYLAQDIGNHMFTPWHMARRKI